MALNYVDKTVAIDEVWKGIKNGKTRYIQIIDVYTEGSKDKIRYRGCAKSLWVGSSRFAKNSSFQESALQSNKRCFSKDD